MPMNNSHHTAALNMVCDQEASLQRVPDDAASDTEREVIQALLRCSQPVELKNDERERNKMGTVASLAMLFCFPPDTGVVIKERDRLIISDQDFRIRKVKKWPMIDPAFYELHVEDES